MFVIDDAILRKKIAFILNIEGITVLGTLNLNY